jgi:hypothetical protein
LRQFTKCIFSLTLETAMAKSIQKVDQSLLSYLISNVTYIEPPSFSEERCRAAIPEDKVPLAASFAIQLGLQGFKSNMTPPDLCVGGKVISGVATKKELGIIRDARSETDLTYSRLCRVFKHEVHGFIKSTGIESQLSRKYNVDKQHSHLIFFGCEYLDVTEEESRIIMAVFVRMDQQVQGGQFVSRYQRILRAKGFKIP